MWWKLAQLGVSPADFDRLCKHFVRNTPFYARLFKHYGIPMKDIWEVRFRVEPMKGKFAETRGNEIVVGEEYLVKMGFRRSMHLVAHELVHWLTRKKESRQYFSDPEEVQGLNWAIAHELSDGIAWDQIEDIFLPLVQVQVKDPEQAKQFLIQRFRDAHKLLRS